MTQEKLNKYYRIHGIIFIITLLIVLLMGFFIFNLETITQTIPNWYININPNDQNTVLLFYQIVTLILVFTLINWFGYFIYHFFVCKGYKSTIKNIKEIGSIRIVKKD